MKNKLICIAIIMFALAAACIRLIFNGVPHAADKNTSPAAFSSERAMIHLNRIAHDRRHLHSPLHIKTQLYIEQEMKKLGYDVQIQDTVSVRSWLPNYHLAASIKNIAARKKGTASTGAVMIMSHYDSVTFGPGAADAGYGVAAMLESARALTKNNLLKNDIIFLFTDAEEAGLMGANAFLEGHPWLKDVKVVVNFEARGTEGPSQMFETGRANGMVVGEFIRGVSSPVGNSISKSLYDAIPNDTDYTLFKAKDIQGLNFANGQRITAYHTPLDNLKNADPETLQHHGENALGLAKHLGNISLINVKSPDLTYFNIIG